MKEKIETVNYIPREVETIEICEYGHLETLHNEEKKCFVVDCDCDEFK